jgi:hypothetical protein
MQSKATDPTEYINSLPDDRKVVMTQLRKMVQANLPKGFAEVMSYGMLGYVVPHKLYPSGYHVNPKDPLPFLAIASQKNFIAFYHMGIYSDLKLLEWFIKEFPKHSSTKLDMGKSCIRFKKIDQIPLKLIGELVKKVTVKDWISLYEGQLKK